MTATPSPYRVTARMNSNCRTGPGSYFDVYDFLLKGEEANAIGRLENYSWLFVQIPDRDEFCWIAEKLLDYDFHLHSLFVLEQPLAPPPPTYGPDGATPTAQSYTVNYVDPELVDLFRMEDVRECGGRVNECMAEEETALMLARIAIGESPNQPDDWIYFFWLMRLRTFLGFKNAGRYSGNRDLPERWGPETAYQRETLCDGGCQFEVVRATHNIMFPCMLSRHNYLRKMLCPINEDLPDFLFAYETAKKILDAPLSDFPQDLRGYDNFRGPQIAWNGQRIREGGLLAQQFFYGGNVWRDEFVDDNEFWESFAIAEAMATSTPIPTATPTAMIGSSQGLQHDSFMMYIEPESSTLNSERRTQNEEVETVKRPKTFAMLLAAFWVAIASFFVFLWRRAKPLALLCILLVSLMLIAAQGDLPENVEKYVAWFITILIALAGPKSLKKLYDWIAGFWPGFTGTWRVVATYLLALVVGTVALWAAGEIVGVPATKDEFFVLAGVVTTVANAIYHRLKDLGEFEPI